jgi:hypothetical protein
MIVKKKQEQRSPDDPFVQGFFAFSNPVAARPAAARSTRSDTLDATGSKTLTGPVTQYAKKPDD